MDPALTAALVVFILAVGALFKTLDKRFKIQNKILLQKLEKIGTNTQQTNDTLNHKEAGDPTVKAQIDSTHDLMKQAMQEVTAIKVEARDARQTAERAQVAAANAEEIAHETRREVVEVKEIAKKLEGSSDTLLDYFGRMSRRSDQIIALKPDRRET